MQETIKKIVEAEKQAAEIVASANRKADEMLNSSNTAISKKINDFRAQELERYNRAVEDAEKHHAQVLEEVKAGESDIRADIESVTALVVKRVMKTIFD